MKQNKQVKSEFSRRDFIKTTAVGVGATALTGIGARETKAVTPDEVPQWDLEADVVVVGFGFAGATAAITAHDKGAKVLLLEKMPEAKAGGNSRVSGNSWVYYLNVQDALTYYHGLCDGNPVPDDMLEVFITESNQNDNFIESLGGEVFTVVKGHAEVPELLPEGRATNDIHTVSERAFGRENLWKLLKSQVESRKIQILYQTPGKRLVQDPRTKEILGVKVESEGWDKYIKANKAVVLTCGGFENNQQMIRDYLLWTCGYTKGTPGNTGDGIIMALEAGADLWHMSNPAGPDLNFKAPEYEWAFGYTFTFSSASPASKSWIWVGADATRFCNEYYSTKHGKIPFHGTYIVNPTPLPVHLIADETIMKGPLYPPSIVLFGVDTVPYYYGSTVEGYRWSLDNSVELAKGWIVKADTIRDLAAKIGKDPTALENTVNKYNQQVAAGSDPEYGRAASRLAPIQTPPYYAMEFVPTFTNTQGGPRRNKDAQILEPNGKPIPRLYSAGELGSIHSYLYQGGGNVGECLAFGRIAGRNAAAETRRS
jgi:succinate dehydrogenase/fumarate reductase flavoprotein subunit